MPSESPIATRAAPATMSGAMPVPTKHSMTKPTAPSENMNVEAMGDPKLSNILPTTSLAIMSVKPTTDMTDAANTASKPDDVASTDR